jgi:hypothetical protein
MVMAFSGSAGEHAGKTAVKGSAGEQAGKTAVKGSAGELASKNAFTGSAGLKIPLVKSASDPKCCYIL